MGWDVFYCCVCASPRRDMEIMQRKLPESEGRQPSSRRKRKRSIYIHTYTCTYMYIHVYVYSVHGLATLSIVQTSLCSARPV